MTTPVSFPLAKLLKEKGFNAPCNHLFFDGELKETTIQKVSYNDILSSRYYIAPTIADVVMWCFNKHNLFIEIYWCNMGANEYAFKVIDLYNEKEVKDSFFGAGASYTGTFNSPTEAYEKAIEYALTTLI